MAETLLVWFTRFSDNPTKVKDRLNGRPVLLYEPPETLTPSPDQDYRFRTQSGITIPVIGGGDPMAAVVEKTKENAFKQRVTIGRTSNNDIVLEDVSVSRFHAFLEEDEGAWKLVDAGSRNGTVVAGQKLSVRVAVVLQNGAPVRIGAVQLTFFTSLGFIEHLRRRASAT
jgi:FHA domain